MITRITVTILYIGVGARVIIKFCTGFIGHIVNCVTNFKNFLAWLAYLSIFSLFELSVTKCWSRPDWVKSGLEGQSSRD